MGETKNQPFQLSFNKFLRVEFQGSRVTSDGGLILVRELDEGKRKGRAKGAGLDDNIRSKRSRKSKQAITHPFPAPGGKDRLPAWCRYSIPGRAPGYERDFLV